MCNLTDVQKYSSINKYWHDQSKKSCYNIEKSNYKTENWFKFFQSITDTIVVDSITMITQEQDGKMDPEHWENVKIDKVLAIIGQNVSNANGSKHVDRK